MESTENLTPLNVEQLANLLLRAYLAMVRSGTPFQKFPSVMLMGQHERPLCPSQALQPIRVKPDASAVG